MPANTTYAPMRVTDFEASKLQFNAQGIQSRPALNSTSNIDLYFSDDHLITGFWLTVAGATIGDYLSLQVVDTDNIMGYGANTVLKTFASNIFIPTSVDAQFDIVYPAKIYAGLSLRMRYTSVALLGALSVVSVNYKLHKILI